LEPSGPVKAFNGIALLFTGVSETKTFYSFISLLKMNSYEAEILTALMQKHFGCKEFPVQTDLMVT
jgi:hypothetical protein